MRLQMQNDLLTLAFSEQLLNMGNEKILLHANIQCIKLPDNFCNKVAMKDTLIESIFPNLRANYVNHA